MKKCNQSNIAVIGAGPTTLYFLCALLEADDVPQSIVIFEKHAEPGKGTPFRKENASPNLLSNLKENEIPALNVSFSSWARDVYGEDSVSTAPNAFITCADDSDSSESQVIPRGVLGEYLVFALIEWCRVLKSLV